MKKKILIADEDDSIRTVLSRALSRSGHHVRSTSSLNELWNWVSSGEGELIVADVATPDDGGLDLLSQINGARPHLPVIIISAKSSFLAETIVDPHKVFAFLNKPFDLNELLSLVSKAIDMKQIASSDIEKPIDKFDRELPLIGMAPAMQGIYRSLARLTNSDLTVTISGEYGTGKRLLAKTLHNYGKRRDSIFVKIDIASVPRDLVESELFGHERGVFTGANQRSSGKIQLAEGGTIFLNEIADLPFESQARLLGVLQDGVYTTVGGTKLNKSDVRIIASTRKNLKTLVSEGLFREELYYFLNVIPMRLPPLRERVSDIPLLLRHFVKGLQKNHSYPKSFNHDAINNLKKHEWPGNVRELKNLVRRIYALYPDERITKDIVSNELMENSPPIATAAEDTSENGLTGTIDRHLLYYFSAHKNTLPATGLHDRILREIEKPLISRTLIATKGNQIKAAEVLGINRNTLRSKIRKLDIRVVRGIR